jgi:hypothetical protein
MADLNAEIAAFERMREDLEAQSMGKWALVHDEKLFDLYESFELAAESAVHNFGAGPYLIRQIGAPPLALPASLVYQLTYGN